MRAAHYDLLCAFLLGLGNMCIFMGYDTNLTLVEPVLHSVNDRAPWKIDAHAGFYGAGLCLVFFMIASLFTPFVMSVIGSKYCLLLGSTFFTIHLATFAYVHFLPYYLSAAAIGVGYALFYTGHGGYITEHSTKKSISRNSALTWALATSSMIFGGILVALTTKVPAAPELSATSANSTVTGKQSLSFRVFSDAEILLMYGAFTSVALLGNVIFAFMPTRNVTNSIAARFMKKPQRFVEQMQKMWDTFTDLRSLPMIPLFFLIGLSTQFWCVTYPTTLVFTKALSGHIYLPAMYLITFGAGEILMGVLISVASKRFKTFAQLPSLIVGAACNLTALTLALLSTPAAATYTPTNEPSILIPPSNIICLVIALLLGAADNTFNTARTVLCALVIPESIAQVYAMSKFYQSLAGAILLFIAPLLSLPMQAGAIAFLLIVSVFCYRIVAKKTRKAEKKMDVRALSTDDSGISGV